MLLCELEGRMLGGMQWMLLCELDGQGACGWWVTAGC